MIYLEHASELNNFTSIAPWVSVNVSVSTRHEKHLVALNWCYSLITLYGFLPKISSHGIIRLLTITLQRLNPAPPSLVTFNFNLLETF